MFGLFKKKSEKEKLTESYNKLMQEAYELSKINRTASDNKYAQADAVLKKLDSLP
jgi:hypothetical protein